MSKLLDDQQEFFLLFCKWGQAAYTLGYRCTFGDAYRDPRASFPYSSPKSFHAKRLAVDVNAFRDGKFLETADDWSELGELWEQMGGTWGGNFKTGSVGDANHLSWKEGATK